MKTENYEKVQRLMTNLKTAQKAKIEIENLFSGKVPLHESDGGFTPKGHKGLYQFHLSEHSDGSGFNVDLTGLSIGIPMLEYALKRVDRRIEEITKEIEAL